MAEQNEPQRLDTMSKILLAVNSITFMAHNLSGIVNDYRVMLSSLEKQNDPGLAHSITSIKTGLLEKQTLLEEVQNSLHQLMDHLGESLNGMDASSPIDERILNPAFDILNGKDIVDEYYEDDKF